MGTCNLVPTFESLDEILWCDRSNETFVAVLLHGTCTIFFFNILSLFGVERLKLKTLRNACDGTPWFSIHNQWLPRHWNSVYFYNLLEGSWINYNKIHSVKRFNL